jgi:DNA-binding NarL/FixJ family response regulator
MSASGQNSAAGLKSFPSESICVLIVDDQRIMRTALRRLLEVQPSFKVCGEAHDGQEAVQKAIELKPEVIVMDINMPGMDGLEATRQIHKAIPNTEILIFTQHELLQVAQAAEDAGARGCVSKSDAARQLVPALRAISEHKPYFPSLTS